MPKIVRLRAPWLSPCGNLDGEHLASFVHAWWSTKLYPDMFLRGCSGSSLGDTLNADSWVLAQFIDFSVQPRLNNFGFDIC